jgi:hypothetical protein
MSLKDLSISLSKILGNEGLDNYQYQLHIKMKKVYVYETNVQMLRKKYKSKDRE